ncbi:major facilitator superfamily domain-containing protein [Crepidotus variabilis]|uniref:Major facilitator superfamily domain-containing protein n=1 Tax=Crepidotus variabilis TaxID=179855 RepID=A0A9P6JR91_9AGAR|nr:major facilitator superfamily domain-containing protein [Crepidotus variabilis]
MSEKQDLEKTSSISSGKEGSSISEVDREFERKTLRYVDWRILPILAMVYSFALIDRTNMGAAYTAGMKTDLQLAVGNRFNLANSLFFLPYTLLQLPGNLILRKVGARNWLSFIVLAWGAVELGMGFVHTWRQLVVLRVLLGVLEASFFPSLLFILSTWYKRHEYQTRLATFYVLAVTTGGFSSILAYVFSLLNGRGGLAGWRWIFVMEGIITLFLGIMAFLFIPEFPDQNNFLTPEQTALILKRIDDDRGDALPDPLTTQKVLHHLKDWTIWAYGLMFLLASLPSYSQSFFLPIILKGMGWSTTASLLLSAPPYGPAVPYTLLVAWLADRYKHRSGFIAISVIICTVGVTLLAFAKSNDVRYFGAFLNGIGNNGAIPTILAYSSNNVVSHSKRSVQTALLVTLGSFGGIIATNIYVAKDAPRYTKGLSVTMASQGLLLVILVILTLHFKRQNRLQREGKRSKPIEGQEGFYYTL